MMEPICEIQGIFKWENSDYETLETINKTMFDLERKIFFALNFREVPDKKSIIIDVILDEKLKSKYLIRNVEKLTPIVDEMVTDINEKCVWLMYVEVPRYAKYSKPGKHTVKIQVASSTDPQTRLFDEANGGATAEFEYVIVDNRKVNSD